MNDHLHHLADVQTPRPTINLSGVERRARAIRRARRTRVGVGTGALAATLALGGVALPQLTGPEGHQSSSVVALALGSAPARADDAAKDCATASADWLDRSAWATDPEVTGAAHLLTDATWPLTGLGVHQTQLSCLPAVPAAVLLGTAPQRGITIWADVADPFSADDDGAQAVEVRGTHGLLRDLGTALFVTWVEDGTRWMVNGSGTSQEELLGHVAGLELTGHTVAPGSLPAGFEAVPTTKLPTDLTVTRWWVRYGDTQEVEGEPTPAPGAGVELEITTDYQEPPELVVSYDAAEVRLVEVDGGRAVFAPWGDPATSTGGWLMWQRDGVTYRLSGRLPVAELVEVAEAVAPVDVDDPAVAQAPPLF